MTEQQKDLLQTVLPFASIILDKGLLAALLVWLGLRAGRLLEEFKSSAAWRNELAKERMAAAKRLSAGISTFWADTWSLRRPRAEVTSNTESRDAQSKKWQDALLRFGAVMAETRMFLPVNLGLTLNGLVRAGDDLRFKLMYGTSHDDELVAFGHQVDQLHGCLRDAINSPWTDG